MKKTLGEKLRFLRGQSGLLQREVADKIGLSVGAYSKMEKDVIDPGANRLKQLSRLYKVSVGFILDEEEGGLKAAKKELKMLKEQLLESQGQVRILQERLIKILETES